MSYSDIQTAIEAQARATFSDCTSPNTAFEIPTGSWCDVVFSPNEMGGFTLGTAGLNELTGLLELRCNYPVGEGDSNYLSDMDSLISAYKIGSRHQHNGMTAFVSGIMRNAGFIKNGFFQITVTVFWYAYPIR
jgi:hypothetical protein